MNIPFHHITPSHSNREWIACLEDLGHPIVRPFSLSDLSRFQGTLPSNQGLDEPFLHHYRRVLSNHRVKSDFPANRAILLAMLHRITRDRDATCWVFLNSLFGHRIAGNDQNTWRLIEGLETLEMFAIMSEENAHWGSSDLKFLAEKHIRSALLKVCDLCRMPGMDSFDILPTNKSLFPDSGVFQSSGLAGMSSYVVDAVPVASYAKTIGISIASQALEGSLLNEMVEGTQGLPLSSLVWETSLKDLLEVDMATGKVFFKERLGELSPLVSWEDMKAHRWNKYSPIGGHDFDFVYELAMAKRPELEGIEEQARRDLMQMAAVQYGKLGISGYDSEQIVQTHVDCTEFFSTLAQHDSTLLGLDMFWGGKDPRQVIDHWINANADAVAGTILSKYSGYEKHIPIGPNRLLGIIMLHSPVENPEHWFCYSLVKMSLLALSRAEAYGISREGLSLSRLREKGSLGNWDRDFELPEFGEKYLQTLYLDMPENLQGISAKLFLGLKLTRQELIDSSPVLRDSAFGVDMGL